MASHKKIEMRDCGTYIMYMCPNCFERCEVGITKAKLEFIMDEEMEVSFNPISKAVAGIINNVRCRFCGASMIQIDEEISYQVSQFNKKGFLTLFSCEGHYENGGISLPYIVFGYDPYTLSFKNGTANSERKRLFEYAQTMKAHIQVVLSKIYAGTIDVCNAGRAVKNAEKRFGKVDVVVNNFEADVNDDPRIRLTVKIPPEFIMSQESANYLTRVFHNTLITILDNLPEIDMVTPENLADLTEENGEPYILTIKKMN
nr:MAG TPA: hypothetical protein [Caudoviricetes sp.]